MGNLVLILGLMLASFFIGIWFSKTQLIDKPTTWVVKPKKLISPGHMPPIYYGYSGGFASTNTCKDCGLIGLYEDLHEARPCPHCGGSVRANGPAKWDTNSLGELQWISR